MSLNQQLIAEYKHEMANTRKILALVPMEKYSWKPHEKSMSLGDLASHLADMPTWVHFTINFPELDFAKNYTPPSKISSSSELLSSMDKNLEDAIKVLENTTDAQMFENWSLRNGNQVFFTLPKIAVLRSFVFSHNIHHRAQLGVYLRMLDIPLPGIYGPSADDKGM